MGVVAFVAPLLPGKAEDHRRFCEELVGARREEYEASRQRLGITREAAWHQETPAGTVSVIFLEADNPGFATRGMGTSHTTDKAPIDDRETTGAARRRTR